MSLTDAEIDEIIECGRRFLRECPGKMPVEPRVPSAVAAGNIVHLDEMRRLRQERGGRSSSTTACDLKTV